MPAGHTIGQATHRMEISWLALHSRRSPAMLEAALRAQRTARPHASPSPARRRDRRPAAAAPAAAIERSGSATEAPAAGIVAAIARGLGVLADSWRFANSCRRQTGCWDDASLGMRAVGATLPEDGREAGSRN